MQVLPSKATFHVPRNAAVRNTMRPTRGVAPFRMHRNCGADLVPGNTVSHIGGSQNQHIQVSAPPNCRRTARLSQRILPALGYITTLKPEQYREIELVIHAKPKKKAASRDSAIASLYFLHSMTFGKRQTTQQKNFTFGGSTSTASVRQPILVSGQNQEMCWWSQCHQFNHQ